MSNDEKSPRSVSMTEFHTSRLYIYCDFFVLPTYMLSKLFVLWLFVRQGKKYRLWLFVLGVLWLSVRLPIYIDDIIPNCMCVIFWTWKWYIESSWIKWNKNWWKQLNIRGSWTKWKSEATNPYLALRVYIKMSEIHETGDVWHKI